MKQLVRVDKLMPNDGSVPFGFDEAVPFIRHAVSDPFPIVVTPVDPVTLARGYYQYMILDGLLRVELAKQTGLDVIEVEVYYHEVRDPVE